MDGPEHPDVRIANALASLSSPTRLALLRALRSPKVLSEIDVRPAAGPGAGRPLARQTITRLLRNLGETGLVEERAAKRPYGETTEYVVNHQQVFALVEEMRLLARLRPSVELGGETAQASRASPLPERGPALILVHGLDEGTVFPLAGGRAGALPSWVVGRRRDADVVLDFDPSVSGENALIELDKGAHWLRDVEGSRNGTTHNLRRLAPGDRARLRHGDLVGVGRSLLLYWA